MISGLRGGNDPQVPPEVQKSLNRSTASAGRPGLGLHAGAMGTGAALGGIAHHQEQFQRPTTMDLRTGAQDAVKAWRDVHGETSRAPQLTKWKQIASGGVSDEVLTKALEESQPYGWFGQQARSLKQGPKFLGLPMPRWQPAPAYNPDAINQALRAALPTKAKGPAHLTNADVWQWAQKARDVVTKGDSYAKRVGRTALRTGAVGIPAAAILYHLSQLGN